MMFKSKQEIFDTVWNHFKKWDFEECIESGECVYRRDDGHMCAAGCLIPDSCYKESMEESPFFEIYSKYKLSKFIPQKFEKFIDSLQHIHDSDFIDLDLKTRLINFAHKEGLSIP